MIGSSFLKSITRQIRRSRKKVTILFTDIEDSSRYWDKHGDVKGRLLIDRHNRLVFPVIKAFHGRIVKTIGDAVMASFAKPALALKAAIAIQQAMERERRLDKKFPLHLRIGVHTGKAIVEQGDIFGDVVNVASRIESRGKADEILVSSIVTNKLKNSDYALTKKERFTPKGKRRAVTIYRCNWRQLDSLIEGIRFSSFLPLVRRQKFELVVYLIASLAALYVLYLKYIRYVISDSERWALFALNPQDVFNSYPLLSVGLIIAGSIGFILLLSARSVPHWLMRTVKGGFGFSVMLALSLLLANKLYHETEEQSRRILYSSEHLFVEILEDGLGLRDRPNMKQKSVKTLRAGELLLLTDVGSSGGIVWNRVLIAENTYAWLPRIIPAQLGVPEKRMTLAYKFYFYQDDAMWLIIAAFGFLWGAMNFRIRPA
ncbi:MAG: hypothetical protein BMS9Abin36_1413 [Gammaproteobacteria bacterium]|nr:MAG: hypothetical protein BMS9Abin36_1413 [Gammaproteobacteria bacterium]